MTRGISPGQEETMNGASTDQASMEALGIDHNDLPSFVGPSENGLTFWAVTRTGHSHIDVQLGRLYAEEAVRRSRKLGYPLFIGCALGSIAESGTVGDVEMGFITRISELAMAGSLN